MKMKDGKFQELTENDLENVNGGMKIVVFNDKVKKYILEMLFKIKKGRK